METLNITFTADETKTFAIAGNYIELLDSVGSVDIVLYSETGAQKFARSAEQGAWMKEPFAHFTIKSSTAQAIKMIVTSWEAGSRRQSGSVAVTNVNAFFSQAAVAVPNAPGGVVLLALNGDRRYLLVQNRDPLNSVYLTLDGSAPTVAGGIKVEPGGALELAGYAPISEIQAIADGAGASVIAVEG